MLASAALAGCIPQKRVAWSPDGKVAAVVAADGLRFFDPAGGLSAVLAPGVTQIEWFADGSRLLAVRDQQARTWDEVTTVLTDDRRDDLMQRAEQVRNDLLAYEGDWDHFDSSGFHGLNGAAKLAVVLYIRDYLSEGMPEKLGERWDKISEFSASIRSLEVLRVAGERVTPATVILRTLDDVAWPRVSPDGRLVAFSRPATEDEPFTRTQLVAPIRANAAPIEVARFTGLFPDWSADSRELVFASAGGELRKGDALQLGVIARQTVTPAGDTVELGKEEPLAGILFDPMTRIRCLGDGRILFASIELNLPCTDSDMPRRPSLFAIDPARQSTVTRLVPRQIEPKMTDMVTLFEVSPDEQRVTVPGSNGSLSVLTLANGEWQEIYSGSDDGDSNKVRMVPTWRRNGELCFTVPPGSPLGSADRHEVVLWSRGTTRCISKDWSDAVVRDFLLPEVKSESK